MEKRYFREGALQMYRKEFLRDSAKFIRASRLTIEHLDSEMEYKGARMVLKGFTLDGDCVVVDDLDNDCHWLINRRDFEKNTLK